MSDVNAAVETEEVVVAAPPAEIPNLGTADPKPEPVVAAVPAEPAKAGDGATVSFEPTGNVNADYALSQIGAAGIGPDHPAVQSALEGDFNALKHALAVKGVPGGDHLIAMLVKAAEDADALDTANAERIQTDVLQMAGSQEHWNAVLEWGRANADEDEKAELNKLFGDTKTHKIAAGYLLSAYDRAGGPKDALNGVVSADGVVATGGRQAPGGPLNRAQFSVEAQKLHQSMGDDYVNSPEYFALGQRLQR